MGIPAPLGVSASGLPVLGDKANAVVSGVFTAVGPSQPFAFAGPTNIAIYASLVDSLTTTAGSLTASVATGTGIAAGDAINSTMVPNGTTLGALSGTTATLAVPAITLYGSTQAAYPGALGVITGLYQTNGLVGATVTGPNIPSGTTVVSIIQPYVGDGTFPIRSSRILGIVQISAAPTGINANNQPVPFVFKLNGNAILTSATDAAASFTGSAVNYSGSVQIERSFDGGATWIVCNVGGSGSLAVYGAGTPVDFTLAEPELEVLYRVNCTAYTSGRINYRISTTGGAAKSLTYPQLA